MRLPAICLAFLLSLPHSDARAQDLQSPVGRIDFADPGGIIHQLSPDNAVRPDIVVPPADKAKVIQLLRETKRNEAGWHQQLAIYYLICLGQDYNQNVRNLLRIWRSAGNEDTMALIIELYKRGHSELLNTILKAGPHSDGALAEELGDFFGEELQSHPRRFISVLSGLSAADQGAICSLAGGADGGGIGDEAEVRVTRKLAVLNSEVAHNCARDLRKANRNAQAAP